MPNPTFEWDVNKDIANQDKHGVSFAKSTQAFEDPLRLIISDKKHSTHGERRFFLHWQSGSQGVNGAFYISRRRYTHFRGRILA